LIDDHLGDLMADFEHVVIHSDHGTSLIDREFYVSEWLDRRGYLQRSQTTTERLADYGLHCDTILWFMSLLAISSCVDEGVASVATSTPAAGSVTYDTPYESANRATCSSSMS
jgi:predicted AlkP superfamily phosphohydrolase/phosphomutase